MLYRIVQLMIISSLFQMLPIILVVLGGFLLSSIESIKVEDLVRIVSDFFMPAWCLSR